MRVLTPDEYLRRLREEPPETVDVDVRARVERILDSVKSRGDDAVDEYTRSLDGSVANPLRSGPDVMRKAWERLDLPLQKALRESARNLTAFQRRLKPKDLGGFEPRPGVRLTARWRPLGRVMCYAPGGRAAYPSTVLMTAIPARVAGVSDVFVASPPQKDGRPPPIVLAAAHLAKVDAVYAVGGAQAVAAFAYGTGRIPRVDKIVGPGNAYVAEAKRQLVGTVGIDGLAGPSELAVIADETADPVDVAIDLAAQAEHDPAARALVVVPNARYAKRIDAAADAAATKSTRRGILARSLQDQGVIVVARDFEDQVRIVEETAPEHVQLMVARPARYTARLRAVGTVFEGTLTPAPLGDYVTGADHVLPTGRTARWGGALSVQDFLKPVVVQRATRTGIRTIGPAAVTIAEAEGLPAHAESVRRRLAK